MKVFAIDPGTTESAFASYDGEHLAFGKVGNDELLEACRGEARLKADVCVIEQVCSYGMAVGAEIFETVYWSGRFAEAYQGGSRLRRVDRVPRLQVKLHLCHDSKAKDANIRQALVDRFGGKAATKKGGVLYRVAGDMWAAIAVLITWWDQRPTREAVLAAAGMGREA